jgi:hypothetical protein
MRKSRFTDEQKIAILQQAAGDYTTNTSPELLKGRES